MCKRFLPLAVLLFLSPPDGSTQPNPNKIFTEMLAPYQNLMDYSVTIHTQVKMEGIRVPDVQAILFFKKPDRFQIQTKKFALLPRNSAIFNPLQFDPEKNQITFERTENIQDTRVDVFKVEPYADDSPVRYFYLWIGGKPRTLLQFQSHPFKGSTVTARISYQMVSAPAESFWLPSQIQIHLTFPPSNQRPVFLPGKDTPFSMGMMMMEDLPTEGDILISYSDWQVNIGLDDKLFVIDPNTGP